MGQTDRQIDVADAISVPLLLYWSA